MAHSPSQIPETAGTVQLTLIPVVGRVQERVNVAGLRLLSAEGPAGEAGLRWCLGVPASLKADKGGSLCPQCLSKQRDL